MLDQRLACLVGIGLYEAECPLGHSGLFDGCSDGLCNQFARRRVAGMALVDNRAAGGERGGGVAPGGRKGQREVRRTKDPDRPQRPLDQPQIGPRQGLPIRQRRVVAHVQVVAIADMVREHAQLTRGATTLAFQPSLRQAGFGGTIRCKLSAPSLDLIRDSFEETCAGLAVGPTICGECLFRGLDGGVDLCRPAALDADRVAGHGVRGEGRTAIGPLAIDQVFAGQGCAVEHVSSPPMSGQ